MLTQKSSDIKERVNALNLPQTLKNELVKIVKLTAFELSAWLNYLILFELINFNDETMLKCINSTQWTPHGIVDRRKTAETLSRMEELTIKERMDIAAIFCLTEPVVDLFHRFSNDEKERLVSYIKSNSHRYPCYFLQCQLGIEINVASGWEKNIFFDALRCVNCSAVKYFWSSMNDDERKSCLVPFIGGNLSIDQQFQVSNLFTPLDTPPSHEGLCIVGFMLSMMSDEELNGCWFLRKRRCKLLICLLEDWIYVQFFMLIAVRIFPSIEQCQFNYVLAFLYRCARDFFRGYEIRNIGKEFWKMASLEMKESIRTAEDLDFTKEFLGFLDSNISLRIAFSVQKAKGITIRQLCVSRSCT
uniref:Uncharacterized protein n=1 Tax=Strigamia maritima TaxID=126957 RepID=T1JDQ1_STRMM